MTNCPEITGHFAQWTSFLIARGSTPGFAGSIQRVSMFLRGGPVLPIVILTNGKELIAKRLVGMRTFARLTGRFAMRCFAAAQHDG